MTVIDRFRAARPGRDAPGASPVPDEPGATPGADGPGALPTSDEPGTPPGPDESVERAGGSWRRGMVAGLVTGLASLLVVVGPAVIAWLVEPLAAGTAWDAVGTGAALWLLTAGAHLTAGSATLSLVPLLGLALLVVVARLGAREAVVDVSTDGPHWHGLLPAPLASALASWWGGYAVVVGAAAALTTAGPFGVAVPSLVVPVVLVPGAAVALSLRAIALDDPEVIGARLDPARLPDVLRRGLRPGIWGAVVLLLAGLAVVAGLLVLSWSEVSTISDQVDAAGFGGLVLLVAQVLALPNLALWAVSFVAGPGFQVLEGSAITWSGAESGLLPMVPVLAALPQPGAFPWFAPLSALGVMVVGGLVARRALGEVARLSRVRTKLAVAGSACLTTALALGALDLLAGGAAGQFRLASVGAPAGWLTIALLAELLAGAVLVVLRDAWRLRR